MDACLQGSVSHMLHLTIYAQCQIDHFSIINLQHKSVKIQSSVTFVAL